MKQVLLFTENDDLNSKIQGIKYISNWISEEESKLINLVDDQNWNCDLKRRVQHYGYKYDYSSKKIDQSSRIGELPDWLNHIAARLYNSNFTSKLPDQVIINEYAIGQGIASHIDCISCFGDEIISLSLGSDCIMDFNREKEKVSLNLERRCLLILSGEARYMWSHGISARNKDKIEGVFIPRKRRVSLTFRNIKND